MTTNTDLKFSHAKLLTFLAVLGYFILMCGNGIVSLSNPDEVFYTQTAKEMLKHHSWATPYIFDAPHFEKPIFFFWLLMAAGKVMGVTPFAMRFFPALFGILGVLAAYGIAFCLFREKRSAFWSAVVLCTSFIHLTLSRAVLTDMVFSMLVVMSIGVFYWGYAQRAFRNTAIVLGFAIAGVAVLTKGVLGLLFPLGVLGIYLLYKKDLQFLRTPALWLGIGVFLAIAVPWHLIMLQRYGEDFIREYWTNVHVRRILEAEHPKSDSWYFYPGTMWAGVLPWSFFVFPAAETLLRKMKERSREKDAMVFLLIWIGFILVVMQAAHSKLASYIYPAFPAVAIIVGRYLGETLPRLKEGRPVKSFITVTYLMAGLLFLVAVGGIWATFLYSSLIGDKFPVYIFTVLIFGAVVSILVLNARREHGKSLIPIGSVTASLLVLLFLGRASAEPWVSCKDIAEVFQRFDRSDSTVLASKFYVRGVRYYTDRKVAVIDINGSGFFSPHPVPFLNTDQKVLDFLGSQNITYAIVKVSNVHDIVRIADGHFRVEELAQLGGKHILKIQKR